ncbi:unnamed protein product [Amoebophrya sp. A120]|nr:unnamed protein product [Amoebophrya sp. A120]|eukprot:GSA120T00003218001.1
MADDSAQHPAGSTMLNKMTAEKVPARQNAERKMEDGSEVSSSFYMGEFEVYGTMDEPLSKYGPHTHFNYNPIALASPFVIGRVAHTMFASWEVWKNVLIVWTIMVFAAVTTAILTKDPKHAQDHEILDKIIAFFRAFIAFMLGLYVSHAAGRFHTIVNEIINLFDHIRQLQTDLIMYGVPEKELHIIERYGVLSMRIFHQELKEIHNDPRMRKQEWSYFFDDLEEKGYLQEKAERTSLENNLVESNADCSTLCYLWIQNLLMRLAVDGYVPPPPSPSFNQLVTEGKRQPLASIQLCKQLTAFQMPFGYAHMLAVLIHLNNWLMGLSAGVAMGFNVSNFARQLFKEHRFPMTPITNISAKFLYGGLFPFFFQGFLLSALMMSSPSHHLPIAQMIRTLEHDLLAQEHIAKHPHLWDRPYLKPPPEDKKKKKKDDSEKK